MIIRQLSNLSAGSIGSALNVGSIDLLVISISFHESFKPCFRIYHDETPIVCEAEHFEIVNPEIPEGWAISTENGWYTLEPSPFTRQLFWDDFHGGVRSAMIIFQEEYNKIAVFHGFPLIEFGDRLRKDVADLLWEHGFKPKG